MKHLTKSNKSSVNHQFWHIQTIKYLSSYSLMYLLLDWVQYYHKNRMEEKLSYLMPVKPFHHEWNYMITKLECLVIVWTMKHFRPYLYGTKFTVITDHSALRWLMSIQSPSGRLMR
jgi:hypothetical protein